MKEDNHVLQKSKAFAVRIIRLSQHLTEEKKEKVLSRQVLRSGTSIGANVKGAVRGQSTADFLSKCRSRSRKPVKQNTGWNCLPKQIIFQKKHLTAF